MSVNIDTSKP